MMAAEFERGSVKLLD